MEYDRGRGTGKNDTNFRYDDKEKKASGKLSIMIREVNLWSKSGGDETKKACYKKGRMLC